MLQDALVFDSDLSAKLDKAFAEMLDEVLWTDNFHQGYVRVDLRCEAAQAEFIAMSTILSPQYKAQTLRRYVLARVGNSLELRG